MKICYVPKRFSAASQSIIEQASAICADYAAQGFDLTLRQLYYQFVSRGLIANRDSEYKRLGSIINDARLAGMLDWDYIVDRTRNLRSVSHWGEPGEIMHSAAYSYRRDKWLGQSYRPEVWIEKDALVGVIESVCTELDVPYFSCRGYTSQSEVWAAGQRLLRYSQAQIPIILHLGDHDPSGIDMTRDITERLEMFLDFPIEVRRLALNWEQVEQYSPPPNPTKLTDSRANGYLTRFGDESWELDALEPTVIADLIREAVTDITDSELWDEEITKEAEERELLESVASRWVEVAAFLAQAKGE